MMIQRGISWTGALLMGGLAVAGCVGSAGDAAEGSETRAAPSSTPGATTPGGITPDPKGDRGPGGIGTVSMGGAGGTGPGASLISGKVAFPVSLDGTPSSVRRLSRDELIASLTMLTGSPPDRADLPEEQRRGHGALLTGGTAFISTELGKLKQELSELAVRVAPAVLTKTGCALADKAQRDCLSVWAGRFSEQALRRPARGTEAEIVQRLLAGAGASREADLMAMEGVLTAMFFSPSFLYRTEVGTPVAGKPDVRALDPNEVAARLSFLATLAPPDTALLEAAKAGRLKDGAERSRHFERLSQTEAGKRALSVFVLEWLGANEGKVHTKSPKYLTGLSADFEPSARLSAEGAIRKVVLESPDPTVAGLLTTEAYLADPAIQKIRQAAGAAKTASGDNDMTARNGLMMHPYVLAAHTKEDGSSPFQLGVFMREVFLCESVPAPPANAANEAKNDVPPGLTVREGLDYKTSAPICTGCHRQFSALGYSFLPFDPVGRWVRQDPVGKPWDLSGTVTPSVGAPIAFITPAELTRGLAKHPQVQACFAQSALRWALGRGLVAQDETFLIAVNEAAVRTQGGVAAIFSAVVSSPEFLNVVAAR